MDQLIIVFHVLTCIALVALVLLQQGKGADIGAAFGSGASSTVFGSQGSSSFLFKLTGGLAAVFFVTSLTLSYLATSQAKQGAQQLLPATVQQPIKRVPATKKATENVLPLPLDETKKEQKQRKSP